MKRGQKFVYTAAGKKSSYSAPAPPMRDIPRNKFPEGLDQPMRSHDVEKSQPQSYPSKRRMSPQSGSGGGADMKVRRIGRTDDFDDEVDELDLIGTAALEQYELTQREGSTSPSSIPIPEDIIPKAPIPILHSIKTEKNSLLKVVETPLFEGRTKTVHSFQKEGNSSSIYDKSRVHHTEPTGAAACNTRNESNEKIQQLLEENYSKDGEVKVLRGEKERLLGELRKKEEQMHQMQTALLAEKQMKEQMLVKERDSLVSKLQFKEQELLELQQKYEQQSSRSQQVQSSITPLPTRGKHHRTPAQSQDKPTEFLSTENFMPLSQLSTGVGTSGVTPIHIGMTRPRSSTPGDQQVGGGSGTIPVTTRPRSSTPAERQVGSGTGERSGRGKKMKRSRSISPSPSDMKKMKKRSKSDKDESTDIIGKLEPTLDSVSGSSNSVPGATVKGNSPMREYSPLKLKVPGRQLDGAQILLLLVKQNLLKPPSALQEPVTNSCTVSTQSSSDNQFSLGHQMSSKITGLLSLLCLKSKNSSSLLSSISSHSNSSMEWNSDSSGFQRQSSSEGESPGMSTPSRQPRLLPQKPHTLARTNLAQSRVRPHSGLVTANKKSLSAANTPLRVPQGAEVASSSSLLSSINASNLHRSIGDLLASSEISRMMSFPDPKRRFVSSLVPKNQVHDSHDSLIAILKQVGDVVIKYYREQMNKARMSLNSSLLSSSESSESTDISLFLSPKSSSTISKGSTDLASPLAGDQQLVTQALEILDTLTTYSKRVREQILLKPPEFVIDSRPSSSLDVHQNPASLNSSLEDDSGSEVEKIANKKEKNPMSTLVEVSHKLTSLQKLDAEAALNLSHESRSDKDIATWKGIQLTHMRRPPLSLLDKVWMPNKGGQARSPDTKHSAPSTIRGSGCGQLFSTLMELSSPPWKESRESVLACFRILATLVEDCPLESLCRFDQLLQKEIVGISLDKEDPSLTSSVLSLLIFLVRSEVMVDMLCRQGESCVLLTCYQCLLDPPSSEGRDTAHRIQVQVVRLISQIVVSGNGPLALFEKCSCSHELLKSLVNLLDKFVDGVYQISQWTQRQLGLVCQVIALVYRISISDHYFDTHRDQCEYTYTFVFNRLSLLFKSSSQPFQEVVMVNELLSYCEDSEDSPLEENGDCN